MSTTLDREFYCVRCGRRGLPIPRKVGKLHKVGHLKRLFCLSCGIEFNHVECEPFSHYTKEDFLLEFNNGNFDAKGNRIMSYGLFKDKLVKEGVIE